jgi:hypothetical protein
MPANVYNKNKKDYTCFCYNVCYFILFNNEPQRKEFVNQLIKKIQNPGSYIYFILNPIINS